MTALQKKTKLRLEIGTYVLAIIGLAILNYLIKLRVFDFLPGEVHIILSSSIVEAAITACLIIISRILITYFLIGKIKDQGVRHNVIRIVNLGFTILIFFFIISVLFDNWYTFMVSLGLISLILGFALQTPITSFIGWMYIVFFRPFKIGDRIKISETTGDVIDINYLETRIWASYGDFQECDFPAGRLVSVPNANVLTASVHNFSWNLFPFIWDEITFYVSYTSDLALAESVMVDTYEKKKPKYEGLSIHHKQLLQKTELTEDQLSDKPYVSIRNSDNTWIKITLHYLIFPKEAGQFKTALFKALLTRFKEHENTILLPDGNSR
jgi:small-conductance mechanosensitive channel